MQYSLRARIVFPVDQPPIENGLVTIEGERIYSIGVKASNRKIIELGPVALMPALVNAHTHLEFSHLQQPLGQPGISLVDWIRLVIAERGRNPQSQGMSLMSGVVESRRFGVATIADITTGIESFFGDVTFFHEVIGFSRARSDSAMNALIERIGFSQPENRRLRRGISPHAPYTVSPKLVNELVLRARQHDLPMAMHLAESREELELLRHGTGPFQALLEERSMWDAEAIPRGSRPLVYLHMLSEAPRALVIHGNYLDEEELQFLGSHRERMSLIYCPRTHAYFFHSPYPLERAIAEGVRVALGTDSRASNPDLDVLAEMRQVARLHYSIDPQQILRMGTLNAAEAFGRHHELGSITTGKLANLIAIPIEDDSQIKPDNVLSEIFAAETAPTSIYLAGRPLHP
jgi:cytosine/adenosine deaminase-related metal-dependent hydrolase